MERTVPKTSKTVLINIRADVKTMMDFGFNRFDNRMIADGNRSMSAFGNAAPIQQGSAAVYNPDAAAGAVLNFTMT